MMPFTKWLLVSLFALNYSLIHAQTVTPGEFVVVEERTRHPNGQTILFYSIAPATDTLSPPVRREKYNRKRAILPKPAWPEVTPPVGEGSAEPIMKPVFYIMSIRPGSSAYEPLYWYRQHP